jgi:hypothetical protein
MANPTTNYGFVLPTATDLVTDLPADFDVALQGVDTRLKALQPGTTLGDLAYSSATANTNTRLAIGSTGNVLTVAGGVPSWAAPAGGGLTVSQIATGTLSGASVTISSLSSYDQLFVILDNVDISVSAGMKIRINNVSTSTYTFYGFTAKNSSGTVSIEAERFTDNGFYPYYRSNLPATSPDNDAAFTFANCKAAGFTTMEMVAAYKASTGYYEAMTGQGVYKTAEAVSSLVFVPTSGTFDGGSYTVWGG